VFLAFIKNRATELEVASKIMGVHKTLPFSAVLGLVLIHNKMGTLELNREIKKFSVTEDYSDVNTVQAFIQNHVPYNVDTNVAPSVIESYIDYFVPKDDWSKTNVSNKDIMHFCLVITKTEELIFKTKLGDLVSSTKTIRLLANVQNIFKSLKEHISLSDTGGTLIEFSTRGQLKKKLMHEIINSTNNTYTIKYNPESTHQEEKGII
jgi:hypothetical protein